MAATDLAIRIATTLDSTGITRANKAVGKLQRSVKGLSIALGAASVGLFAKNSLKAFVADELAATRLANAVKNLGLEFANPYIADYIAKTEQATKVTDDMLRPAFQRLLQQTGSLAKSQSILNTAIEVSRGTGESLTSVSEDLAKAYYGQTRSLRKYSLGLTQAELQAASFSDIQDILNKKFSGSSAAYLNTYAGQLDIVSLSWRNLQENAGKALFILAGASGDQSSGARRLGGIVDAFGVGLIQAATILNNAATAFGQAYFGVGSAKPEVAPAPTKGQELFRKSSANDAKLKAIEKQQAALYKAQMNAQKALTAEQKKQALLKKAGSIFDLEQIQLIAALKGQLSEEDRKRVELQFALITGNTSEAQKLTYELAKAQGLGEQLARYLATLPDAKNPFASWDAYLDMLQKKAQDTAAAIAKSTAEAAAKAYSPAALAPELAAIGVVAGYGDYAGSVANQSPNTLYPSYGMQTAGDTIINVQVQGNVIREQELIDKIMAGTQLSSLSGSPSQIGRIAGMFG